MAGETERKSEGASADKKTGPISELPSNVIPSIQLQELEAKLGEAEAKAEQYLDRLRRIQADYENYQKLTQKETAKLRDEANEKLIVNILPILDQLEKGLESSKETNDNRSLIIGMRMIVDQLRKVLEKEGLEEILCVGRFFDPSEHEAVSFVECSDGAENMVVQELRRGYKLKGRVIRPSMVEVTRKPRSLAEDEPKITVEEVNEAGKPKRNES